MSGLPTSWAIVLTVFLQATVYASEPQSNLSQPYKSRPYKSQPYESLPYEPAQGYAGRCALCHENNGMGEQALRNRLGKEQSILSQRSDLNPDYIRYVVRHGLLAMPALSKVEVPDTELEQIIKFLTQNSATK